MAKNTGRGHRQGAVKNRTQYIPPNGRPPIKRGPDGRWMDQKADNKPFKGITKER